MGEDLGDSSFAVRRITVQTHGGSMATFVRKVREVFRPLTSYFAETGHAYRRYNYLGEWHSHPSFAPVPSGRDEATMWDLVQDPTVGATFAVLLIVRLEDDRLTGSATVFAPPRHREPADLVFEREGQ